MSRRISAESVDAAAAPATGAIFLAACTLDHMLHRLCPELVRVLLAVAHKHTSVIAMNYGNRMSTKGWPVQVCSEERQKFPFDIQHRNVITYKTESASDFDELRQRVTQTIHARVSKAEVLKRAAESDLVSGVQGLSHIEVVVLAAIATEANQPLAAVALRNVRQLVEQQGVTALGAQLAFRRLVTKLFVALGQEEGEWGTYDVIQLTNAGWDWIENNDSLFVLNKPAPPSRQGNARAARPAVPDDFTDDDIPF